MGNNYNMNIPKGNLKRLLTSYSNGVMNHYKNGDFEIATGGYDMWFEIYVNKVPAIGCVNGTVAAYNPDFQKYLGVVKEVMPYLHVQY